MRVLQGLALGAASIGGIAIAMTIAVACSTFGAADTPTDAAAGTDGDTSTAPDAPSDSAPAIDAQPVSCGDAGFVDLTQDSKNCGACGVVCSSRSCFNGLCDHIVFVTSDHPPTGDFDGPGNADVKCKSLAIAAELGGEWVAWISTIDNPAGKRLGAATTGRWLLADGKTVVASSFQGLSNTLINPIAKDEKGATFPTPIKAFSNTHRDGGAVGPKNCLDWTSNDGSEKFCAGDVGDLEKWSFNGQTPDCPFACDIPYPFYCFQK